jgi:isopentenyl-diphosphate Delta-isomerase
MELIDVLTFEGAFTGRVKSREEIHRDGDWHRAAHLWIATPDGRVLLQRRAAQKDSWPLLWDVSIAGHVGAGETAQDAAMREAREELGLQVSGLEHLGTLRFQALLNGGAYVENELHEVYLVRQELDLGALTLDPEEVAEVALVAPDDVERLDVVPHPESYALLRAVLR